MDTVRAERFKRAEGWRGPAGVPDLTQCPICQEQFEAGATVLKMPCLHAFHKDCLLPWLRTGQNR